MKKNTLSQLCIITILLFTIQVSKAQIPNASFENFTTGNPDGWQSNNLSNIFLPVTKSTQTHSGTGAVQLKTLNFSGQATPGVIQTKFSISSNPQSFSGWYKLITTGKDTPLIFCKTFSSLGDVSMGFAPILTPTSTYKYFAFNLSSMQSITPDSAQIVIVNGFNHFTNGTTLLIDELSFSNSATTGTTDLEEKIFSANVYPNPAIQTAELVYQIKGTSQINIELIDIAGKIIKQLLNENQSEGIYKMPIDVSELKDGIYFIRIKNGENYITKKLAVKH